MALMCPVSASWRSSGSCSNSSWDIVASALFIGTKAKPWGVRRKATSSFGRGMTELVQGGLLAMLFFLLHGVDAAAVLVALENRRNGRDQLLDEMLHVVPQPRAPTAGQAQQLGPGGMAEVVHVAPVGGRRRRAGARLRAAGG
jgi:hypothetical protein